MKGCFTVRFSGCRDSASKNQVEAGEVGSIWRVGAAKWVSFSHRAEVNDAKSVSDDAPLAQLVEQLTLNQWVPGSSP